MFFVSTHVHGVCLCSLCTVHNGSRRCICAALHTLHPLSYVSRARSCCACPRAKRFSPVPSTSQKD